MESKGLYRHKTHFSGLCLHSPSHKAMLEAEDIAVAPVVLCFGSNCLDHRLKVASLTSPDFVFTHAAAHIPVLLLMLM